MDWKHFVGDSREKYHLYLCSREWAQKKEAVRQRCGGVCEVCRERDMEAVHHLTYIRKYDEHLEDLQGCCRSCHDYIHHRKGTTDSMLTKIDFEGHEIRMVGTADCPEWVASDVSRVLRINNPREVMREFDDEEKGVTSIDTPGGPQKVTTLFEPGLYRLVLLSRKPDAKRFKGWLCKEVLPSIRKHGCYPPPVDLVANEHFGGLLANLDVLAGMVENMRDQALATQANSNAIATLDDRTTRTEQELELTDGHWRVRAFASRHQFNLPKSLAKQLGLLCTRLCREQGIPIQRRPDEDYGTVNAYPEHILRHACRSLQLGPFVDLDYDEPAGRIPQ